MISTTLAAFPSPAQGVWHLGPLPIRAYAVCIIVGIIAALLIGDRRWVARGGEPGVIYDIALWAVPFGLIGGRLYHVLTDWETYFGPGGAGALAAFKIWDGGLGIWGAVALGGVGAWIGCRRRGIPLPAFGDAIAPGIVLAQAIGRLGNYFNQELYGRETDVPWAMEIFYRRDPSGIVDVHSLNGVSTGEVAAVVHPTFLYELLWNLLVFVLLLLIDRWWKIGHGRLFASYVALYCVGRFWVELLRDDTATHIAGIRINSYTSMFVLLGAVVYIILAPKGREDASLLRGRDSHDEEVLAPELAEELVAVAGSTGVVAAATVAGAEDSEYEAEADETPPGEADAHRGEPGSDEAETEAAAAEVETTDQEEAADGHEAVDEAIVDAGEAVEGESASEPEVEPEDLAGVEVELESEDEAVDVEPVSTGDEGRAEEAEKTKEEAEDEALVEAEAVGPGVEVESADEVEDELIDEDHDPVDDPDFEDFLGAEDSATPDVDETAPADNAPEGFDAAIDEAVAIEQVTDFDDSGHADRDADSEEPETASRAVAAVDPAEADESDVVVGVDDAGSDESDVVIEADDAESDAAVAASEDSAVEGAPVVEDVPVEDAPVVEDVPDEDAPVVEDVPVEDAPAVEEASDATPEPDLAESEAAEPVASAWRDSAGGAPTRRSRLGRLFRRRR